MNYIQFQYNMKVVNSDNISVMLTTVTNSTNITHIKIIYHILNVVSYNGVYLVVHNMVIVN